MKKIAQAITRIKDEEDFAFVSFILFVVADTIFHFILFFTNVNP